MVYQGYDHDYFRKKVIITVATTGGAHGKEANPNLPEQPEEIAADVRECEKAGASVVHLHARDDWGDPTKDVDRFQEIQDLIQDRCDDIIVNFTSSGKTDRQTRLEPIVSVDPRPELASLDMGPVNFGRTHIAEHSRDEIEEFATVMREHGVKPEIELFNVGQLSELENVIEKGLVSKPYYCNLILGMQTGQPPHPRNLLNYVDNLPEDVEWTTMAVGKHQLPLTTMGLVLGGHVRVGLEDNVFYCEGELATSNAQLVRRTARLAEELERPIATADEARSMIGLE